MNPCACDEEKGRKKTLVDQLSKKRKNEYRIREPWLRFKYVL